MKEKWTTPKTVIEEFTPNEYIASCYDYTAEFYCTLGKNQQQGHGTPCAVTKAEIKGNYNAIGQETGNKTGNPIYDVNLHGFNLDNPNIGVGTTIPYVTWTSEDPNGTGTYYHKGDGKFTSKVTQIPGRPNHS